MIDKNDYSRKWVASIDSEKIKIYPIQFANCDRLQHNDIVYIFDEVGSGKTISSGLMAMDFLMNNSGDKVLVVTTNNLVKNGQFLDDWYEKLPYEKLKLKERVDIVNNHFSSFKYTKNYGLVIIDEAHLFINKETKRYKELTKNIKAKKIVFLTATPIKEEIEDLNVYMDIAKEILDIDNVDKSWIKKLETIGKDKDEIICNIFNKKLPVTRYFKDTIKSLREKGYEKTQSKRKVPELWKYENESNKIEEMINQINNKYKENKKNKFIVFTRYVEREAKVIEEKFKNSSEFVEFDIKDRKEQDNKSYYIVTGKNAHELKYFSGKTNIPTVLILTYQIAEQGVNLPGYNHVINYHIPAFLSSLEQRFGRIDRMTSGFGEIDMCYLISETYDNNTINFYNAMMTCRETLLSQLPSRNTILTKDIIKECIDIEKNIKAYFDKLLEICKNEEIVKTVFESYKYIYNNENEEKSEDLSNILLEFCIDNDIELENIDDEVESKKEALYEKIERMKKKVEKQSFEQHKEILEKLINDAGDKVFYKKSESEIDFIDPIEYSAYQISESDDYKVYLKEFNEQIKLIVLIKKYKDKINNYFVNEFNENRLENIFPIEGYKKLFVDKILNTLNIKEDDEDKEILLKNIDTILNKIPFFEMCKKFKEKILKISRTQKGYLRIKYDFNPFEYSLISTIGNEEMKSKYENKNQFYINEEKGIVKASNWYKLAFHYIGKEKCYNRSLFKHFIYGDTGKEREWVYTKNYRVYEIEKGEYRAIGSYCNDILKVEENDIWTRGICENIGYKVE